MIDAVWAVIYNGFWIIFGVAFLGFLGFLLLGPWWAVLVEGGKNGAGAPLERPWEWLARNTWRRLSRRRRPTRGTTR